MEGQQPMQQPIQQTMFATNLDGSGEGMRKDDKDMFAIIPVMWTKHSWTNTLYLHRFLQTTTVSMEFRGLIPKEDTKTIVTTYKKLKRKKKSRKMKEDKFDFDSTEQHIYDLDDDIDPSELGYFKPAKIYTIPKSVDEIIEKTKELLKKTKYEQLDLDHLAIDILIDIDREYFDMCELPVRYQEEEDIVDRFKVKFVQRLKDKIVTKQQKAKLEKLNKILQIVLGESYMVTIKETKPKKSVLYRLRKFFAGCFLQCFPRQKRYNQ